MPAPFRPFRRELDLLRARGPFRLLYAAAFGSSLGTMLAAIALTVDIYDRTHSGRWVGALLVAEFLPTIAIGLLLGPLFDRLSRRALMVGADLARLGAFAALPFAPNAATIVGLALVVGVGNGFFSPAANAALPNLVPAADLARANSLLGATTNLTWMLGPVVGGGLLALSGPSLPYWVNAATFALSAALLLRIPRASFRREQPLSRGHWRDLADGFAIVRRSQPVLTVLVVWSIASLGNAAVNVGEVFLVRDALGGGNLGLGVAMGAAGLGLVAGSLLVSSLVERVATGRVYAASIACMAIGIGGGALAPSVAFVVIAVLVSGFGNGAATVCNQLILQTGVPDALRGRAITTVMSVSFAALALGMATAGALTDRFGPRWLWGGAAAAYAAAAAIAYLRAREVDTAGVVAERVDPIPVAPAGTAPELLRQGERA